MKDLTIIQSIRILLLSEAIDKSQEVKSCNPLNIWSTMRMSVQVHPSLYQILTSNDIIIHISSHCIPISSQDSSYNKGDYLSEWSLLILIQLDHLVNSSPSIACIYNSSMRCLTQGYVYTRLRMNRLKSWSIYV